MRQTLSQPLLLCDIRGNRNKGRPGSGRVPGPLYLLDHSSQPSTFVTSLQSARAREKSFFARDSGCLLGWRLRARRFLFLRLRRSRRCLHRNLTHVALRLRNRNGHAQHAVLKLRACVFCIGSLRQSDSPVKFPISPLGAPDSALDFILLKFAFSPDNQKVIVNFDVDARSLPTCLHQWTSTRCLSCARWSPHSDWYGQ
jgi:hypothetical protein